MTNVVLTVESRPGHPKSRRLTISDAEITIVDKRFRWADIDRISYRATVFLAMGFDQGAMFIIGVGAGDHEARFVMQTKGSGVLRNDRLRAEREQQHASYALAVALLEANVGERLVGERVHTLRHGGSVEIGGLRLDPDGLHKKGLLSEQSARWSTIDGTRVFDGFFHIWAGGNERKPALATSQAAWNVVLLPRIIAQMGGPPLDDAHAAT